MHCSVKGSSNISHSHFDIQIGEGAARLCSLEASENIVSRTGERERERERESRKEEEEEKTARPALVLRFGFRENANGFVARRCI